MNRQITTSHNLGRRFSWMLLFALMASLPAGAAPVGSMSGAPERAAQHYRRAQWLEAHDNVDAAIKEYEAALGLEPSNKATLAAIARLLPKTAQVDSPAREAEQPAIRVNEPRPNEGQLLGWLRRALGGSARDRTHADTLFRRVLRADDLTVATKTYSVSGSDPDAIWQSLHHASLTLAAPDEVACTRWRYHWRALSAFDRDDRQITTASITAHIVLTLPQWTAAAGDPPELSAQWKRFSNALLYHEQGHQLIAEFTLAALRLRIDDNSVATQPLPVSDVCDQVMQDYGTLDDQYDQATEHGALQGAVFEY